MVTGESGKPVVLAAGPDDRIVNLVRAAGVASVAEGTRTRHWIVGYGEPGWSQVLSTQVLADITDEFVTGLELRSPLGE